MSIDVTTIPKEPQWEDIVIDADKDFNWFFISRIHISNPRLWNAGCGTPINMNSHRIINVGTPVAIGDALSIGNPIPTVAGDAPFSFNDTVQSTGSITFVKVKETRIWRPGAYRIRFDMRSTVDMEWVWGVIRRNGENVGTERGYQLNQWNTFTEDINGWNMGDFVQVYARSNPINHVEVRNLRLFIHESNVTEAIL